MIAVWMVQMSIDQIVDMIAMWNRLMTTVEPMSMRRGMSAAAVVRRATIRIRRSDFDHVFIGLTVMHMMQMAVVEIIDVALMPDRGMTTARPVDMRMFRMTGMIRRSHDLSFPRVLNRFLLLHWPLPNSQGKQRFGRDRGRAQ
jgi:hypothetical protein